jgi:hypothetical protein
MKISFSAILFLARAGNCVLPSSAQELGELVPKQLRYLKTVEDNYVDRQLQDCKTPGLDWDGDGVLDCEDDCPYDPTKTADLDGDGDGTPDCMDECPQNNNKIKSNACGCWVSDADCKLPPKPVCTDPRLDTDNDGTPDCSDACPYDSTKTVDADGDGDGTPNCMDECPQNNNRIKRNACGCWTSDANCKKTLPPSTTDCADPYLDSDMDGTPDCVDYCPYDRSKTFDVDGDGDGTPDCMDECPQNNNRIKRNSCGCWTKDEDCLSCPCWNEDELDQVTAGNVLQCYTSNYYNEEIHLMEDNRYYAPDDGVEGGFAVVFVDIQYTYCVTRDYSLFKEISLEEAQFCAKQINDRCADIGHPY